MKLNHRLCLASTPLTHKFWAGRRQQWLPKSFKLHGSDFFLIFIISQRSASKSAIQFRCRKIWQTQTNAWPRPGVSSIRLRVTVSFGQLSKTGRKELLEPEATQRTYVRPSVTYWETHICTPVTGNAPVVPLSYVLVTPAAVGESGDVYRRPVLKFSRIILQLRWWGFMGRDGWPSG